jgi:hypothetical protein
VCPGTHPFAALASNPSIKERIMRYVICLLFVGWMALGAFEVNRAWNGIAIGEAAASSLVSR